MTETIEEKIKREVCEKLKLEPIPSESPMTSGFLTLYEMVVIDRGIDLAISKTASEIFKRIEELEIVPYCHEEALGEEPDFKDCVVCRYEKLKREFLGDGK